MIAPSSSVLRFAAPLVVCFAAVPAFAQAPAKVTYVDHILPIFRNTCANCHNPDKKKAGLDLTTYAATMVGSENGPVVKPGQGDASLIFKVCAQTEEPKMPPKGDKLTDAELATLKNWITGFALENATSKPAAVQQNQVALAVVSLERPAGPPPMPGDLPLEPFVKPRAANAIVAMAASPWAPLVALGGQKQIVLYNTESLQAVGVLPFPEGFPQILRFSRNGQLLLAGGGFGGKSGQVVMWNILDGKRAGAVGDEVDQVLAADISPDHAHIALGGPAKVLKIFATKDGKLEQKLKKHTEWITAVAFSPDGKFLASADRNGGVMVWEGASGKEYQALAGHKTAVTALAFMPGVLASAGADGKIMLWNVKEGTEIRNWTAHAGGVEWIDFTPDGRLVSCGRDKTAKVWDSQGKALFTSEAFADIALRAELNSERVVAADWTGRIRAFGIDGKPLAELTANLPPLADQLAAATKKLTDSQAALPPLQQALAAAEAKLNQEIAATQKAQSDAEAGIESAKAGVAAIEKRLAEQRAESEKLKAARQTAEASAEADAAVKKAAIDQAAKALDEANASVTATDAELNKAKAGLPKTIAAQEKAIEDAKKRIAELGAPIQPPAPPPTGAGQGRITLLQKKLDELNARIEARRAERAKFGETTPEYARANEVVQALKPEIAQAEAALATAGAPVPAAPNAPNPQVPGTTSLHKDIANARAAADACNATIAAAQADLQRLQRATAYMAVHRAEENFADVKAKHEDLVATAKDASRQADMIREQIASLEKSATEAPATLKQTEDALAAAVAARDGTTKALAEARTLLAEKEKTGNVDPKPIEAEVTAAEKKVIDLNAEIANRRAERAKHQAGSEEYKKADAVVQGLKPEIAQAEQAAVAAKAKLETAKKNAGPSQELLAAREAVKKGETDARLAADKVAPAEKAAADIKKTQAENARQLEELREKAPAIVKAAKDSKVKAESEAAALAAEVDKAKAEATRIRADFESKWQPAQKTASAK